MTAVSRFAQYATRRIRRRAEIAPREPWPPRVVEIIHAPVRRQAPAGEPREPHAPEHQADEREAAGGPATPEGGARE